LRTIVNYTHILRSGKEAAPMLATKTDRPTPHAKRELEGKIAIVTGSTSGIGLGIARALAQRGANVVLNGFGDAGEIEIVRAALAAENTVEVAYDAADMSKPEAIGQMIRKATEHFGQVDILVNNAGIQHVSPIEEFPIGKWDAILAVNLSAAFHTTRAVFAGMKARKWGRVVNVASAHGLVASPFKSAYVAAKHGILGLTKVTALEGAEHGITSNAICPGYVWTPLVEKQIDDQARSHGIPRDQVIRDVLLANQPNKKFATVEEIGALTAFLCSDSAASITGTALPVDGGWTAH
jgi:3-hydroxybutyrate dehydrogenase